MSVHNSVKKQLFSIALLSLPCLAGAVQAPLDAGRIAQEVYTAAHGRWVKNAISRRHGEEVALVVNRAPLALRDQARKPSVQTFDTYVNNRPGDPLLESLQMAILTSGKVRGTGILFTSYRRDSRRSVISLWLPALRKIRRISEPSHEDVWFGTNLTYGELVLRRPEDERHELLGEGVIDYCLEAMALSPREMTRHTRDLPAPQCGHRGKPAYQLKSTTKFSNWWYDYHISDIDKTSFALYRTVYYKGDERVKTVYIDWQPLDQPDPRITYPRYIYAISHGDGKESLVYVPRSTISLNMDLPDAFWSEETLRDYDLMRH